MIINRLIRIYTPFVCALFTIIHGVVFLLEKFSLIGEVPSNTLNLFGNIAGSSIFGILYIFATSRRMCKWFVYSCYFLLANNISNIMYYVFGYKFIDAVYIAIVLSTLSLISFIIYRIKVGLTKLSRL